VKSIGNESFIDENGQLYITKPGTPDPFDPPGTQPPPVVVATGETFEDVPTYGWPLGVIYKNNPLQFATAATADRAAKRILGMLGPNYIASVFVEEVNVGPFRWAGKRMILVSGGGNRAVLNAGLEAVSYVRAPEHYAAGLLDRLK
jgi:hypothetical protein